MENKLENINIEQNKELFEYEMTEVILNLKGEFAVFSGKNTKFAEMAVDDSRLKVDTPKVGQVNVDLSGVYTPTVGNIQCPKIVSAKVEESNLKLPIIPQLSTNGDREEGSESSSEKNNVWDGISLPDLSKIESSKIIKRLSGQSLEGTKRIKNPSIKIPQLIEITESTPFSEKKTYCSPISIHAPKTDIKHENWIIGKIPDSCTKKIIRTRVPQVRFNALTRLGEVKKLSKTQIVNSVEIKVPDIITPVSFGVKKESKAVHTVKIPEVECVENYGQKLPVASCEPVRIDYPFITRFQFQKLNKPRILPVVRMIELRETHKPKFEIKNPTLAKEEVHVPEIKYIQPYKCAEIDIKNQPILVPNAQKCDDEKIDIKRAEIKVSLPETELSKQRDLRLVLKNQASVIKTPVIPKIKKNNMPNIRKTDMSIILPSEKVTAIGEIHNIVKSMDTVAVAVPSVAIKEYRPTQVKRSPRYKIEIPSEVQPCFNGVTLVEYKPSATNIEIHSVNVGKIIDKVVVDYYGDIAIPKKPDVKETVDNIIALAVAKA